MEFKYKKIYAIKRADFYLMSYKKANQWEGTEWASDSRYAKRYVSRGAALRIARWQQAEVVEMN